MCHASRDSLAASVGWLLLSSYTQTFARGCEYGTYRTGKVAETHLRLCPIALLSVTASVLRPWYSSGHE